MTALDYILNGLEAELQLERELGVRFVECDRSVLEPVAETQPPAEVKATEPVGARSAPAAIPDKAPLPSSASVAGIVADAAPRGTGRRFDFVFLHERPLSPKGSEMISQITAA